MNNSLLNQIITGTTGILNTANKIIPLYEEFKPLYKRIVNIKDKIKNFNINNIFKAKEITPKEIEITKKEEHKYYSSNPQFFQ